MTPPSPAALRRLARILPAGELRTDEDTLRQHAGDKWFASQLPHAVVLARSTRSVALTLQWAKRHAVPVTPRGAGHGYVGGCVPLKGGLVLSLDRMNRIREISRTDFVAVVQPGVRTQQLQDAVEAQGLYYPPDPASRSECSLGGNIATNAGGPRCLKYGVTRDYVLGLEVVLADGTTTRLGGRTHKNKTGFELARLFVGSEGLLGVVTEATLKLLPLPPARACAVAGFSSMLDGQPNSVKAELRTVERILNSFKPRTRDRGHGVSGVEKFWKLRREFSYALRDTGLTKLNEDVVVPRGRLEDLFAFAERLQKRFEFPVACFGHAGDGNIHVNVMIDLKQPGVRQRSRQALDALFQQVIRWGGAITGEHGVGLAKIPWWKSATSPETRHLHQLIRQALDPTGILNPGKFASR